MSIVNWNVFEELAGASTDNFEQVCRALIRRHYGQFGQFNALANQPGIEFHLKLDQDCTLGQAGRWFGWQCRWYEIRPATALGKTRRDKIQKALKTTERQLPELTDWVLWTRNPLARSDQEWFNSLPTSMTLHQWTSKDVEDHLSGPGIIFRETYFGELVLSPQLLGELHKQSVAPIQNRWMPEVHQVVDAERELNRYIGCTESWSELTHVASRLCELAGTASNELQSIPETLAKRLAAMTDMANDLAQVLSQIFSTLEQGDFETLRLNTSLPAFEYRNWEELIRQLRKGRYPIALLATNLLADIHAAHNELHQLSDIMNIGLVAIVADAGCGKTQLAAQFTQPKGDGMSAGILLHGGGLKAGDTLHKFTADNVIIHGRPVSSFHALVAAVDAAGRRANCRLPILIDGLNESEDPRNWKQLLAPLRDIMREFPYALVICTLRVPFVDEVLPGGTRCLEIANFQQDTRNAIRQYFDHYRIDATDAWLPEYLLKHPLTLRLFCEVTNPKRQRTVGLEAMPGSLTVLFDRYLRQVANRIYELSARDQRYYEADVISALNTIGAVLWETRARSIEINQLRRMLQDENRTWDKSIIFALEQGGILIRTSGRPGGSTHLSVAYDSLAGHIVADSFIIQLQLEGRTLADWLNDEQVLLALMGSTGERFTLAIDTFEALIGLVPQRLHGQQVWPLLNDSLQTDALHKTTYLAPAYLDIETVNKLVELTRQVPPALSGRRDLFYRLWELRAAFHPLNADFLETILRPMTMASRDMRWSEWVRHNEEEITRDILHWERRWKTESTVTSRDVLRARWIMWTLTSTVRLLRDHATRALYWFGNVNPSKLFELTLESLGLNDPYIPERMLAASYGVVMALWAAEEGDDMREALVPFARTLVNEIFVPNAPHPTWHALTRDYALGIITLARTVDPSCISEEISAYLEPPFAQIPTPFVDAEQVSDAQVAKAKEAIRMDFGNYTIGRVVVDRGSYDFANPTYQRIRKQIEFRLLELGYSPELFSDLDNNIEQASYRYRSNHEAKIDRYGKKYSWIAYFEMHGLQQSQGTLDEWRLMEERTSDADIDPSFPERPKRWTPPTHSIFSTAIEDPKYWIVHGPTPDYRSLLCLPETDGQIGPWTLLDGYVQEYSHQFDQEVFTFLHGLLVKSSQVEQLIEAFCAVQFPGNIAIPEPRESRYTYAGEIPWSRRFGSEIRGADGVAERDIRLAFEIDLNGRGIAVEIPAWGFAWESYHSELNKVNGITLPAPAICESLQLTNRRGEWDFYDHEGNLASLYRESPEGSEGLRSHLLYLRSDLLHTYLKETDQTLVWLSWGERGFDKSHHEMVKRLGSDYGRYANVHKRFHLLDDLGQGSSQAQYPILGICTHQTDDLA